MQPWNIPLRLPCIQWSRTRKDSTRFSFRLTLQSNPLFFSLVVFHFLVSKFISFSIWFCWISIWIFRLVLMHALIHTRPYHLHTWTRTYSPVLSHPALESFAKGEYPGGDDFEIELEIVLVLPGKEAVMSLASYWNCSCMIFSRLLDYQIYILLTFLMQSPLSLSFVGW